MNKRITAAIAAMILVFTLFAGCSARAPEPSAAPPADSLSVTDDLGREVDLTERPARVAALTGSFAEVWLLAGGSLCAAADDAWSELELGLGEDVADLGSSKRISAELLFEAEADLVLASANTSSQVELRDTLERAGVRVLYFDVNGFGDYLRMLRLCTLITGREDLYEQNGLAVAERVEAAKAAAARAVSEQGAPRVLFLRAAASGVKAKNSEGTVLGEMLRDLGCVNIADGSSLLEDLSLEKIIEEDPDRVFIVPQGDDGEAMERTLTDSLTGNPAWAGLTAVREGRVHFMDKRLFHFKPNARWGEAYEELEALLYGA